MQQYRLTWRNVHFICFVLVALIALTPMSQAQQVEFEVRVDTALLMDATTGQILYERNVDEQLEPASLVKIMTLLVAMDAVKAGQVSLSDPVRTSRTAWETGGSQVFLAEGETHSLEKMLRAIAIASANDASVAVAEFFAGTVPAFTNVMNARAEQLGMHNTYFANADGLPVRDGGRPSLTTARDIAIAARELITKHPEVLEWTSVVMEPFRESPEFILYNTNNLLGRFEGMDGLKTGHTESAGWNLVATAKRGPTRLISVIMKAPSSQVRSEETEKLLSMGFTRFVPHLVVGDELSGHVTLRDAAIEQIPVKTKEPVQVLVPRGQVVSVNYELVAVADIELPIQAGDHMGELVVTVNESEVLSVPVYAEVDTDRAGFGTRMWRAIRDMFGGLFGRK